MQQAEELAVFRAFARACPVPIRPNSIESRQPNEPDILCEVEGQGAVAFELVEVIDPDFRRRLSEQGSIPDIIEDAQTVLTAEEAHELQVRCGNALVWIVFEPEAASHRRRAAIPHLLRLLTTISSEFIGEVPLGQESSLAGVIRQVRIARGSFSGPCFDVENVGWLGDPVEDRLGTKFGKKYKTEVPIELLVYYDWQPIRPTDVWLPGCQGFVVGRLDGSPFRRVWVFDVRRESIEFVWPEAP